MKALFHESNTKSRSPNLHLPPNTILQNINTRVVLHQQRRRNCIDNALGNITVPHFSLASLQFYPVATTRRPPKPPGIESRAAMKIVLAGASGYVGREVLNQAIVHPSISTVVALSRRPLTGPPFDHPKVKVVVVDDFETGYTPQVLEQLQGAVGCCWAIGSKFSDASTTRKVYQGYTLAAATAFSYLARNSASTFRFAHTSGFITVRDQKKSLWVLSDVRKIGGEAEVKLLDFAKANETPFEAVVLRPAGVRAKDAKMLPEWIIGTNYNVRVDELAAVLIDSVVNGVEAGRDTLENAEIVKRGRELLANTAGR
ncbi:hypothetical protein BJ875DRAFT_463854 [Amylocarpus encephaloides]|uniref:NAD(P)-binding domain-containing protein n=1 Tax=Amylocarpus encephaloides TaxID=45428 RepID=A0A9P7YI88_9HELO|nr:hypothetical protein BJ875DRAFT_463854 [Amylocarpus encephaloides]